MKKGRVTGLFIMRREKPDRRRGCRSFRPVIVRRCHRRAPAHDDLALADMVGRADQTFLLHAFDQGGGAVVANAEPALNVGREARVRRSTP